MIGVVLFGVAMIVLGLPLLFLMFMYLGAQFVILIGLVWEAVFEIVGYRRGAAWVKKNVVEVTTEGKR